MFADPSVLDGMDPEAMAKYKSFVLRDGSSVPPAPGAGFRPPSTDPQDAGPTRNQAVAQTGGFVEGRTPGGSVYRTGLGGDTDAANMNALGRGGVGDQAEALRQFTMQQHGPGPGMYDPANRDASMKTYLGLAKQATDQGRAGVEEYLGLGKLGNDTGRLALDRTIQTGQLGLAGRAQTESEAKGMYERDKQTGREKMVQAMAASGMEPGKIRSADAASQKILATRPGDVGAAPGAIDPATGKAHPPLMAGDVDLNEPYTTAMGHDLFGKVEEMVKAGHYTPTILAHMQNSLGDQRFIQGLPAIQQYIQSRYGANAFKDALNPSSGRQFFRKLTSTTFGQSPWNEDVATAKLRNFLGMGNGTVADTLVGRPTGPTGVQASQVYDPAALEQLRRAAGLVK